MKWLSRFLVISVLCGLFLSGCDLQPKIASIPDTIGNFISDKYPALLADPEQEPEIYYSAVTDYRIYASPELSSSVDDYVLYASNDDYILVPDETEDVPVKPVKNDSKKTEKVVKEQPKTEKTKKIEKEEEPEKQEEVVEETPEEDDFIMVPGYTGIYEMQPEEKPEPKPEEKSDKNNKEAKIESKPEQNKDLKIEPKKEDGDIIIVAKGDTVYSLSKQNNMTVEEFAKINNLKSPYALSIGQKLHKKKIETEKQDNSIKPVKKEEPKKEQKQEPEKIIVKPTGTKRVDLQEITVTKGDTLFSISRKYEIPVNDLAVINKISAPFALSVGQKLKVPKLDKEQTRSVSEIKQIKSEKIAAKTTADKKAVNVKGQKQPDTKVAVGNKTAAKTKATTDAKKQLPKISARSASKFSWPIRGKILSGYGTKEKGKFNDGINISATTGSPVKAAENGVVAYAGNELKGWGNLVIIQHSDGWMTIYAHLDSLQVRRGAKVSVGQQIGKVGKTGRVDKPQLHFEIRKGTRAYNPITYLKK